MIVLILCWKKCKDHGGPVTDVKELNQLVKNTSENKLKKLLRQEVALKKMMHPNDAKEKPQLYKMILLSTEQITENQPYCSQYLMNLETDSKMFSSHKRKR